MNTDVASAQNTVFIEKIPCSKACPTQGLSRRSLKIQGIDCTATRRTDAHCNKTPPLMHRLAREPQSSLYRHALVMRNPHGSYALHGAAQAGQPTKISHHLYKCEKFHIQRKGDLVQRTASKPCNPTQTVARQGLATIRKLALLHKAAFFPEPYSGATIVRLMPSKVLS